jgi:hypothetical protein
VRWYDDADANGGHQLQENRGMLNFNSKQPVRFCDGLSRRDFLRVGSLGAGAAALNLAHLQAAQPKDDGVNCILLFLVGGPSQLDTWDLKPNAPSNIRGPFKPIHTVVPGIDLCEHFPLMARQARRIALVRSLHHQEAPIHETGHQLMQTGRLCRDGLEYPHYGAVMSHCRGQAATGLPPYCLLPGPIANTGVNVSHGQGAGFLGPRHEPLTPTPLPAGERGRGEGHDAAAGSYNLDNIDLPPGLDPARLRNRREILGAIDDAQRRLEVSSSGAEPIYQLFASSVRKAFDLESESDDLRQRYGSNTFGQSCLLARRLVERGVRLVTVNMFDSVFDNLSWDCHADGGSLATTLSDYGDTLCPMFDRAYATLLDDLYQRGLLANTLVLAMGEFGRTPQLNPRGGRDHWPGVWSMLFAGAGVRSGQVVGSSDAHGAEPRDRPVRPAQVAATVYRLLGIDPGMQLQTPDGRAVPLTDAAPIGELFS